MPKFYGELQEACLENLSSDPSSTVAGRLWRNTTENRIKLDDGTNKRALLRNDDKAVIGNSVTASQNVRLHRGGTGLLQFVPGDDATAEGSPSTSLSQLSARKENYTDAGKPAFGNAGRMIYITDLARVSLDNGTAWDLLLHESQGTTKGDILVRSATGFTRLPVGLNGQGIVADSAEALGVRWASIGVVTTTNHSSAYSAAIGDGVSYNDASGGGYTITLPTAVGNNGEQLTFVKTDSSFNVVTIGAVTTLNTQDEKVTIRSNGTAWVVEDRYIPSVWFSVTLGVAGGFTVINAQYMNAKRVGDSLHIQGTMNLGVAASPGQMSLPSGLSADTTKNLESAGVSQKPLGVWSGNDLNNNWTPTARFGQIVFLNASPTLLRFANGGNGGGIGSFPVANSIIGSSQSWSINCIVPISGWNG